MTPAEHIDRAERLLDVEPITPLDFIALAVGHAVVALVRHEAGHWGEGE